VSPRSHAGNDISRPTKPRRPRDAPHLFPYEMSFTSFGQETKNQASPREAPLV
jgi:hypothetical protein